MLNIFGDRMIAVLDALELYDTDVNHETYAEVYAIAVELGLLKQKMDELLSEMFVQTASDYGLTNKEKMWGRAKTHLSDAERRLLIQNRYKLRTNCLTPEKLYNMMPAFEFDTVIAENSAQYSIDAYLTDTYTNAEKSEITAIIKNTLPVACNVDVIFQSVGGVG